MNRNYVLMLMVVSAAVMFGCSGAGDSDGATETQDASSATATATAAALAKAEGYGCDFRHANAHRMLDDNKYSTECFHPRNSSDDIVAIVSDARDLATNCPVGLRTEPAPSGSPCEATDAASSSIVVTGDQMFVHEWRDGKYSLTLRRDVGKYRTIDLELAPATGGGTPYLIGHDADATYAVYITNADSIGGRKPKDYRLEVFAARGIKNPPECLKHVPSFAGVAGSCVNDGTNGVQTNSSGGGEPPPR